ncbi:hypothetical protein J2Z40_001903 [Cytobacillus eiseniae]|uniref:YpoC-like domain-containing protein n=1 Tax=Cytobacillus eiseniae TaxID=762947 RepID=A0ABS4REL2_9BACI|nr:hypothetical protein [Cytobacillus eiseniae]MBP2241341.1 hypothetical protein [Cytobacillus eiseniae]
MNEQITISIPAELQNPFFFSQDDQLTITNEVIQTIDLRIPFLYEAVFYAKIDGLKPWEMSEQWIPKLKEEWQNEKEKLERLFAERNYPQTIEPMKKGIGLFLQFVFWGNAMPVNLTEGFSDEKLAVKPVNMEERISFIIQRPSLYHSFVQVSELIIEMEKQYVKQMAIKKVQAP